MNGFLKDLRFGLRQLADRPGFATAAILTLALGIGANMAVFSVLSGYLLKPLPYPDGAQLVQADIRLPQMSDAAIALSLPFYQVIRKRTNAFAATAIYDKDDFNLNIGGHARRVTGVIVSASLFDVLDIQPLLGRAFSDENMHAGSDHVALISYGLWRQEFGADPDAVGATVRLNGDVYRIVGVMPKGFAFPNRDAALWVPPAIAPTDFAARKFFFLDWTFVGRLAPGVEPAAAERQVQRAISTWIRDTLPASAQKQLQSLGFAMEVRSYRQTLLGDRPSTLWLLQGAVLLVLLMTCVNVANLLLSRILGRSHEFAMRSTLGATRAVLVRQLWSEALCLTVPGGLAGAALFWFALQFLAISPLGTGGSVFNIAPDWRVGLFAAGAVLATAILISILPVRQLAKTDLQLVLQEGGRTSSGGRHTKRTRNALVIVELTLATGLLAVAGLLLHSFMNLQAVDPGFRKDNVLMADLLVSPDDHAGDAALSSFYADLADRVSRLPGVRGAAVARELPLDGDLNRFTFSIRGQDSTSGQPPSAMINNISPGYFEVLGIPMLQGRQFDARDVGRPTAIVDTGLVKKYFRDADPLGRQVRVGGGKTYAIVGVVPSIKYTRLSETAASVSIYPNVAHSPRRSMALVMHTSLPPGQLIKPLRRLMAAVDPAIAVYDVRTMHEQLSEALRDKQTTMALLLAFGAIALALAIVGVYAVMSYAVGQRRRECGVRLALGALPADLSWLVLKDGLRLLVIGLAVGLGLAVSCGYLISAQLFGVAPFDPVTLIGSAGVLCVITLTACYLPARRAARLDPAVAIQEQ
ncbi:MAG TPA: ABC transporter permease [Gammaproteobacteria bacterium]|nr:ABC transporter permease [Gammaproteobacteria bacterium]